MTLQTEKSKNWVFFKVYSIEPITEQEALLMQTNQGEFMPQGYGFYSFECKKEYDSADPQGREHYVATWKCSRSCE